MTPIFLLYMKHAGDALLHPDTDTLIYEHIHTSCTQTDAQTQTHIYALHQSLLGPIIDIVHF